MATPAQWLAGARPRTLPNAIVPVMVGTGVAIGEGGFNGWRAVLALLVALSLQIGVNYANDYSDGIRGTDDQRVGPMRLVGSRVATPRQVLGAALGSFAAAAVLGLILVIATQAWWVLLVGAAAIAAGWFYTGGSSPYGYRALGEVAVFVFFGVVPVTGTAFVQTESSRGPRWWRPYRSGCCPARCWWSTTCATSAPTARWASGRWRSCSARRAPVPSTRPA